MLKNLVLQMDCIENILLIFIVLEMVMKRSFSPDFGQVL